MKRLIQLSFGLPLLHFVEARKWKDLVSPLLYRYPGVDANRILLVQEHDPFDFNDEDSGPKRPTVAPVQTPAPVHYGTPLPTTAFPTTRYENIEGNGGCQPNEILHEIGLFDLWGDGWDNTRITITKQTPEGEKKGIQLVTADNTNKKTTISEVVTMRHQAKVTGFKDYAGPRPVYQGTLENGHERFDYLCLEADECYDVHVGGGNWESDVRWEIRKAILGESPKRWGEPSINGFAPSTCHFSIAGNSADGALVCPNNCGVRTYPPTLSPTQTQLQTPAPSPRPTPRAFTPITSINASPASPSFTSPSSPSFGSPASPAVSPAVSPAATPIASPAASSASSLLNTPSVASPSTGALWPGYTPSMNFAWPGYTPSMDFAWPGYTPSWNVWEPASGQAGNLEQQWAPAPFAPAPWAPAPWAPAPAWW